MCGIIGICGSDNVVSELYHGLGVLQHRGQDAAGIITYDQRFHLKKGNGLVQHIFNAKNITRLVGNLGVAHVRYPTVGGGDAEDAQPFYINTPFGIAMAHNGNVTNYFELKAELTQNNFRHLNSNCDLEVILNVLADELMKQNLKNFTPQMLFKACAGVFRRVIGSYSIVGIIAQKGFFAFRDPCGIKPLVYGKKIGVNGVSYAFASESVALDVLGYKMERDVLPGEVIFIEEKEPFFHEGKLIHSARLVTREPRHCIFEWVYFARPDSVIDGINVYETRLRLGQELSTKVRQRNLEIDVVIPVPDTAKPAAEALAHELNLPCREGLIKSRYIGRTFIMPQSEARAQSVRQKLNPIKTEIEGRKVLLVDDSIVRGTTSREIVNLVRSVGARRVYFGVTAPPLRHPCVYGIDMQTRREFIAQDRTEVNIAQQINADELIYQTLPGLIRAVDPVRKHGDKDLPEGSPKRGGVDPRPKFCTACFNGEYPTPVSESIFQQIELDRVQAKES